jgi:hypothetical protein
MRIAISLFLMAATAFASPIVDLNDVLGIQPVTIDGKIYPARTGGAFVGAIANYATVFWCVDGQTGAPPSSFTADVVLLGPWPGGFNELVQSGLNTNWGDGLTLVPLQRYQAAAWLMTQYTGFPNGPQDTNADWDIQMAIWRLLYDNTIGGGFLYPANNDYTSAVAFIQDPSNAEFGFGKFAVVSGAANPNTGALSPSSRVQTTIVLADPVPEPRMTGLLVVLGLAGAFLKTKRHS